MGDWNWKYDWPVVVMGVMVVTLLLYLWSFYA